MDLTLIAWALILEAPLSIAAAVFLWLLHGKSRRLDSRVPKPRLRLSLILSITGTLGALASTFLGVSSFLYITEGGDGIVRQLGILVYLTFPVLGLVSIINALYLRWLEAHPEKETIIMVEPDGSYGEPLHDDG